MIEGRLQAALHTASRCCLGRSLTELRETLRMDSPVQFSAVSLNRVHLYCYTKLDANKQRPLISNLVLTHALPASNICSKARDEVPDGASEWRREKELGVVILILEHLLKCHFVPETFTTTC